jgi:hypothetical protein
VIQTLKVVLHISENTVKWTNWLLKEGTLRQKGEKYPTFDKSLASEMAVVYHGMPARTGELKRRAGNISGDKLKMSCLNISDR